MPVSICGVVVLFEAKEERNFRGMLRYGALSFSCCVLWETGEKCSPFFRILEDLTSRNFCRNRFGERVENSWWKG